MIAFRLGKNDSDLLERLNKENDRSVAIRKALRAFYAESSVITFRTASTQPSEPQRAQQAAPKLFMNGAKTNVRRT